MTNLELEKRLRQAGTAPNFMVELHAIANELSASGTGAAAIRPILLFMENNPTLDFGAPGPLVHFVEQFAGAGYEAELFASLARRPTVATVGMLNRLIVGAENVGERAKLMLLLEAAGKHPAADDDTKGDVAYRMQRLTK